MDVPGPELVCMEGSIGRNKLVINYEWSLIMQELEGQAEVLRCDCSANKRNLPGPAVDS